MKTILFVCHGNICRSVAAEFIMKDLLKKMGLDKEFYVFSRATSTEEIGNDIYPPMKRALSSYHIPYNEHHAKQINNEDYQKSDVIYYMDTSNLRYLNYLIPDVDHKYRNITCFSKNLTCIDDPWYTGCFDEVIEEITQCIKEIIPNLINLD